jgi:hypothetical protein
METLFLVLSGAILAAGVLYWLWSHIQLTQKKVQLLENAVFELRGMLTSGSLGSGPGPGSSGPSGPGLASASGPGPAPASGPAAPYKDLADDDWETPDAGTADVAQVSTPLPILELGSGPQGQAQVPASDDLMPGGRAIFPEEATQGQEQGQEVSAEQFRELFISSDAVAAPGSSGSALDASKPQTPESLESMPLKELRRLAEQRGIKGSADMRKKEILTALRSQISIAKDEGVAEPVPGPESLVTEILE